MNHFHFGTTNQLTVRPAITMIDCVSADECMDRQAWSCGSSNSIGFFSGKGKCHVEIQQSEGQDTGLLEKTGGGTVCVPFQPQWLTALLCSGPRP